MDRMSLSVYGLLVSEIGLSSERWKMLCLTANENSSTL